MFGHRKERVMRAAGLNEVSSKWAKKFSQMNDMEIEDVIEAALLEYIELFDVQEAEQLCRDILKRQ